MDCYKMGSKNRLEALESIPLDRSSVSQTCLNVEGKTRSNLFPWNGQFSPELIAVLLKSFARPDDFVVDPFVGSGTVLVEAGRLGMRAAGADVNPAPYKIARIYRLINCPKRRRSSIVESLESTLFEQLPETFALLCSGPTMPQDQLKETLVRLVDEQEGEHEKALLSALIVLLDFYQSDLTVERVFTSWGRLKQTVLDLPYSKPSIEALNCDARALPLEDDSVGFVITSPPYINVFNYHQKYRASVEALGWDLLEVAKSEIGSNRKHRGNRFLTVIQYCLDMTEALREFQRVCSPDARMVVIMGRESRVRKTPFYNGDIVVRLASRCVGLSVDFRQERVFQSRFGKMIYEDLLHLSLCESRAAPSEPSDVAREVLKAALEYAPSESMADLENAILNIPNVRPSPVYTLHETRMVQA